MLRLHGRLGRLRDGDLARLGDLRLAPDHIDLVLLQQHADATVERARHTRDRCDDGGGIEADLARPKP